jgi:hypothetical protein
MKATLFRNDVRKVERRDDETRRLLRLGWLAGLGGVEEMSSADLKDALSFRGRLRPGDPAYLDSLLPLYPESLESWHTRRAAADVLGDPGTRFVRFREFTLAETGPGAEAAPQTTTELIDSPAGRAAFGAIQAVTPFDAVQERLDDLGDRGRSGAVITRLEFQSGSDRADAEVTFYVRSSDGAWSPRVTYRASATLDEPAADNDPDALPESAAIRTSLRIFETVASTPSPPGLSDRRQALGATAQRAMARARSKLDADLVPLALPVFTSSP